MPKKQKLHSRHESKYFFSLHMSAIMQDSEFKAKIVNLKPWLNFFYNDENIFSLSQPAV